MQHARCPDLGHSYIAPQAADCAQTTLGELCKNQQKVAKYHKRLVDIRRQRQAFATAAAEEPAKKLLLENGAGFRLADSACNDTQPDAGSAVSDLSPYTSASVAAGPSSVVASTVGGKGKGVKKKKRKQKKVV